jgi:hypothetical protein
VSYTQSWGYHDASDCTALLDPEQLAFELGAILAGANLAAVLNDDNTIIDRAREAIRSRVSAPNRSPAPSKRVKVARHRGSWIPLIGSLGHTMRARWRFSRDTRVVVICRSPTR